MARFNGGWVKLYRSVMEGDIKDNAYLLALWSWLLAAATWKESKILEDGRQRVLPPGTVVFGMSELAETWQCSKATISKWSHYLHDTQRITLETRTRGSIATILNWDVYQGEEIDERTTSERQVNAGRTPSERQVNGSEEVKKERKNICAIDSKKIGEAIEERDTPDVTEIQKALKEWGATLLARGIQKDPRRDEVEINRLVHRYGIDRALDALRGLRFESASKDFDPKKHCRISRIAGPKFDYFENLGAQNRNADQESEFFDPSQESHV